MKLSSRENGGSTVIVKKLGLTGKVEFELPKYDDGTDISATKGKVNEGCSVALLEILTCNNEWAIPLNGIVVLSGIRVMFISGG